MQVFAQRIEDTNALLDVYIDLLRQTDRTQRLLLDGEWKGATEVSDCCFLGGTVAASTGASIHGTAMLPLMFAPKLLFGER